VFAFAPKDALFVVGISNAKGEQRWDALLKTADGVAKVVAPPRVPKPSNAIAAVEGLLGIKLGKDILGRIDAIAITMPGPERLQALLKGRQPVPPVVGIIQGTSEDGAAKLVEDLPKIIGSATFQDVKAVEKTVGGQKLYQISFGNGPALVYGRHGATIVAGAHPELVAEALSAGAKGEGFSSDKQGAAALQRAGEPIFVAVLRPIEIAGVTFMVRASEMTSVTVTESRDSNGKVTRTERRETRGSQAGPPAKELQELAKSEEPLVISVTHKPGQVQIEATYPGLDRLLPKVMEFGLKTYASMESQPKMMSKPKPSPVPRRSTK
jgi:hypothetical protein